MKARAYKDRSAKENAWRTLTELFEMRGKKFENTFSFSSNYILKEEEIIFISKNFSRLAIKFISFSVADVKTKISSLRTYYTRELNKENQSNNKSGAGRDELFISK